MSKQPFSGDKKKVNYFLWDFDRTIIEYCLPRVPLFLSTVHLTMMTLGWSVLIIICGYLANSNILWLWGFNLSIFFQHVTDMLDGAVGRKRNTGLIKWGFYMDHFLDYIFLCAVIIGYSFLLPSSFLLWILLCITFSAAFMVHFFLDFAITNEFKISFNSFGSSEIRYVLISFNILLIYFGKNLLVMIFPYFVILSFVSLWMVIYKSQKIYSAIDMDHLNETLQNNADKK